MRCVKIIITCCLRFHNATVYRKRKNKALISWKSQNLAERERLTKMDDLCWLTF